MSSSLASVSRSPEAESDDEDPAPTDEEGGALIKRFLRLCLPEKERSGGVRLRTETVQEVSESSGMESWKERGEEK